MKPLSINVKNMTSTRSYGAIPNQFEITTAEGVYFQSYQTIIAFRPYDHVKYKAEILLDEKAWDYSRTTGKYRNAFLREDKKATEAKIKNGQYKLVNLN